MSSPEVTVELVLNDARLPGTRDATWDIAVAGGRVVDVRAAGGAARGPVHLDCAGGLVTPGFRNTHTHAALVMVRGRAEDLGSAPAYTPGVPNMRDLDPDTTYAIARLGHLEALLAGSTTVVDSYAHAASSARAAGELGLRAWVGEFLADVDFDAIREGRRIPSQRMREETWERMTAFVADAQRGAFGARIAPIVAPHAPDTCSRDLLATAAGFASEIDAPMTVHLSQSRGEEQAVREITGARSSTDLLARSGVLGPRTIVAHAVYVGVEDRRQLGERGTTVAHVPKGNLTGGMTADIQALRSAGARLSIATDNMHADMVEATRWALGVRRALDDGITDEWGSEDVFSLAVGGGFIANDSPALDVREGDVADLVVWDLRRPHLTPSTHAVGTLVHCGRGSDVRHVLVDGRIVVAEGRHRWVDHEEVRAAAHDAIRRVWARAARRAG